MSSYRRPKRARIPRNMLRVTVYKSVDQGVTNYTFNNTGQMTTMNLMREGVAVWNRLGRRARISAVILRGHFEQFKSPDPGSLGIPTGLREIYRLMVVYDRQSNGLQPTLGEIVRGRLQDGTASAAEPAFDGPNVDFLDRYKILYDMNWKPFLGSLTSPDVLPFNGNSSPEASRALFRKRINCHNYQTRYSNSSTPAVFQDIAEGSVTLVTCGNLNAGVPCHTLRCAMRCIFQDDQY